MLMSIINQGLIFSLVAIAVYLTSRIIKKDDLTVEGSFGFGGAVSAVLLEHSASPLLTLLASLIGGALIGATTGLFYTRLKMNHLMAGLVTTTACFSLSLAIASANRNVASKKTVFGLWPSLSEPMVETIVLFAIAVGVVLLVRLFLRSELGLLLRATGDNADLLVHFGKSSEVYYVLGFSVANALTALAGSLFVQWSGFFSITGNVGTLVTGLASLMIAELLAKKLSFALIFASIAYQSIFALTLTIGLAPVWNNLVKAIIIVILVALSSGLTRRQNRGSHA